jgi:tetratricopeptide (TPR) repeat protein
MKKVDLIKILCRKLVVVLLGLFIVFRAAGQSTNEHYQKASAYWDKEDYENVIREVNLALKADPNNVEYLLLKGNSLASVKRFKDAFDAYTLIIKLAPLNTIALNQRGLMLNSIQEFDYAIQDFDKALAIEKADTMRLSLYLNRGAVKQSTRDFQGAYDDFISAYHIDSTDLSVLNNLASVTDEVGKGEQTLKLLFQILNIDSTHIGAYVNIGFKYQQREEHEKAILYFTKAIALDPKGPLGYSNRSYSRYKINDLAGAMDDIEYSLKLYPGNSYAVRTRALIFIAQQKVDRACQDLQKALEMGFTRMYGDEVEKLSKKYCSNKTL